MGVPSMVWFDRWWFLLVGSLVLGSLMAALLAFHFGAPFLTGPLETAVVLSVVAMLVATVGFSYSSIRFWRQMERGRHLTRAERRRRVWAYLLAFGVGGLTALAEFGRAHDRRWLWAYVPVAVLFAIAFAIRPRKRARHPRTHTRGADQRA